MYVFAHKGCCYVERVNSSEYKDAIYWILKKFWLAREVRRALSDSVQLMQTAFHINANDDSRFQWLLEKSYHIRTAAEHPFSGCKCTSSLFRWVQARPPTCPNHHRHSIGPLFGNPMLELHSAVANLPLGTFLSHNIFAWQHDRTERSCGIFRSYRVY